MSNRSTSTRRAGNDAVQTTRTRASNSNAVAVPSSPFSALSPVTSACPCGGGCPRCSSRSLDSSLQTRLEHAYDTDLGNVRIHDDPVAGLHSIRQGAAAFAQGRDIFFAPGRYRPDTAVGRQLIAHEVAHTVQQNRTSRARASSTTDTEAEANAVASHAISGKKAGIHLAALPGGIQRQPLTEAEILARLAELERIVGEPVSRSPAELNALQAEHYELQLQLTALRAPSSSVTPASRPVRSSAAPRSPEPIASTAEPQVCEANPLGGDPAPATCEMSPLVSESPVASSPPPVTETGPPVEPLMTPARPPLASSGASPGPLVCEATAPVEPVDMVDMVISQRGFSTASPTPEGGVTPPTFEPGALGPGYQTNAVVQVIDGNGNQVAIELGQYAGGGADHAEAQAISNLAARLAGQRFPGGRLVAAVDQRACGGCMGQLRALARQLGLESVEVWGPGRVSASGRPVSPKWAARSSTSAPARPGPNEPVGGRYRANAELLQGETVTPAAGDAAPLFTPETPVAPVTPESTALPETPITPEAPPPTEVVPDVTVETPEAPGGGGWGGTALGVAPIALGFFHSWAESRRMQQQVAEEGFAPVGPEAHADENIVLRLGNWMLDPFLGGMTPASQRFNLPIWRRHVREMAQGRDHLTISWEVPNNDPALSMFPDHTNVEYQRNANGRWEVAPGQTFPEHFSPPDLNVIVDPGTSDSNVQFDLACSAGECA